jgi:hypothetical protein
VAAFGVFDPAFLTDLYERGRASAARGDILAAREGGAARGLEELLGDRSEVAGLGDTLLAALAQVAGTARPLFSGLRELPVPGGPHGGLWRAAEMYREHRGDSHLAACVAAGLDPAEMNVLTELAVGYLPTEYSATRGYAAEPLDRALASLRARGWLEGNALSDAGRLARAAIEGATDAAQAEVVTAIGDQREKAIAVADDLSKVVLAAGAFPADVRKRAAG